MAWSRKIGPDDVIAKKIEHDGVIEQKFQIDSVIGMIGVIIVIGVIGQKLRP